MIQLNEVELSKVTKDKLLEYQKLIDNKETYAEKVEEAKEKFKSYNKIGNKTFDEVKVQLNKMCCGSERCNYCEDSKADEIEHISPKSWYPEKCFVWLNYCYACGTCNGPKNNKFAIFRKGDSVKIELVRKKDSPVLMPTEGEAVLISPRGENPLDYIFLDISNDSFFFIPMNDDKNSKEYIRADYTIDILGLNKRSYLPRARRLAFSNFNSRLSDYIAKRDSGSAQEKLDEMIKNIKEEHHQTVWQEMIRQRDKHPVLQDLFKKAPEAIAWG